jgi:hypothetical protein
MEEMGILGKLVSGLTPDERKELLGRLESNPVILKEPLRQDAEQPYYEEDAGRRFSKLSLFARIWYHILGILNSKTPLSLFKDREILALGRKLETSAGGIYNAAGGYLLPQFYEAIRKLKENSRFFYSVLDMGFNRDKGAFYGFLGSLEMENIHSRLNAETNPALIAEKNPGLSGAALRQTAQKNFEDILLAISEEQRHLMYTDARSLVCLKQLSSFLYDRLLLAFTNDSRFGGMVCKVSAVREALVNLNNILFSLKECPSLNLLESFFTFSIQEQKDRLILDVHAEIQKFLAHAETSIAAIREFNRKIPLAPIARLAARNVSLAFTPVSGGEDWFLLYKDFWKRYIDTRFSDYMEKRRRRELWKALTEFFQGFPLKSLKNAASEEKPDGIPVLRADSLNFLLTFYTGIFITVLNPPLRILLIDGEFRKKDDRLEYVESYNGLISLDDVIGKFDRELSPDGDWGKRYARAESEMSVLSVKRRKLQIIRDEICEQANAIIERSVFSINTIIRIINSVTAGNTEDNHGMLFNLTRLNRNNPKFTEDLKNAEQKLMETAKMLAIIQSPAENSGNWRNEGTSVPGL